MNSGGLTRTVALLGLAWGSDQVAVAPVSLVVPAYVQHIPWLPVFIASLGHQTVQPLETIIVMNIPEMSEYNGPLLLTHAQELRFDNMTGMANLPIDATVLANVNDLFVALDYRIVDVLVRSPSIKVWVRSQEHSDEMNRMFGVEKCDPSTRVVSFFDPSDIMHPSRVEYIWNAFKNDEALDTLVHTASSLNYADATTKAKEVYEARVAAAGTDEQLVQLDTESLDQKEPFYMWDWLSSRIEVFSTVQMAESEGMKSWLWEQLENGKRVEGLNISLGIVAYADGQIWEGEKGEALCARWEYCPGNAE